MFYPPMPRRRGLRMTIGMDNAPRVRLRSLATCDRYLFERRVGEGIELHLHDRSISHHRHADGKADDARLGQRRVEAAVLAEVAGQPVGHPEHSAKRSDVFPNTTHVVIGGHRVRAVRH